MTGPTYQYEDSPPDQDGREETPSTGQLEKFFKCHQCGAKMEFVPGSESQQCSYCDHVNAIPRSEEDVEELDFHAYLQHAAFTEEMVERLTVKCQQCGAESSFEENITSRQCPFCGIDIVATAKASRVIKPRSLLPFHISRKQAHTLFREWLGKPWFVPKPLKKMAVQGTGLTGMYIPYWTYDTCATTFYRGQRGDYYYETEYDEDSDGDMIGYRVRHTEWTKVSGTIRRNFDDVLIIGSRSLPTKYAEKLEPWDLQNLIPYLGEYLSGFRAESYQVDLGGGFERVKSRADPIIMKDIKRDIGGDKQRISLKRTRYGNITFKHLLLPVWIGACNYKGKVYRFLINGRTGEVQGEHPLDWLKAILTGAGIVAVVGAILWASGVIG